MNDVFTLSSGRVAVGDPTIGLITLPLALRPGSYRLVRGALRRPGLLSTGPLVDTEIMVVYAMDATVAERFDEVFHRIADTVSYDMAKMLARHDELQTALGEKIGFYWVGDLAGGWTESKFAFNTKKIKPESVA